MYKLILFLLLLYFLIILYKNTNRVSLKDFLEKVSGNPGIFGKFGIGKPITIASF